MGDETRETDTPMYVYVVMGNDFPAVVFECEREAGAYCERRRAENAENGTRIYWRVYGFPLFRRDT